LKSLSGLWRKIKNFCYILKEKANGKEKGVLLSAWQSQFGESPPVSFETLMNVYLRDPAARAAVDFLADQAVGAGFYTTAEISEAKEIIDNFNEAVNLDGLLLQTAREVVAFGNCFWEKIEPTQLVKLQILPITSIEKIQRDKFGTLLGYKQTPRYGNNFLEPNRIIHFHWNPTNGEAFGTGILRSLAEALTFNNSNETRPAYILMKASIEKSMTDIIKKYAGPTEIWKFIGLPDDKASQYAALLKSMPREGARFVVNVPAEVEVVTVDPRSRFDTYIEHIWNQFILGLQTPLPKLFTTPGFTEASAKAAIEIAERKVTALQRFLKRTIEHQVFTPLILQAGMNPTKANCRLNWGTPDKPQITVENMLKAFELNAIRKEELRKMLVKAGWELWDTQMEEVK